MNRNNLEPDFTGVKLAHEYMVDLTGALIPGVLFLFSVIVSVIFPLIAIYGFPFIGEKNSKIINSMSGWFWVVVFFTFLILSYAIGHVFYRSDIKTPDRKDLLKQRKKFLDNFFKELKRELKQKLKQKQLQELNLLEKQESEQKLKQKEYKKSILFKYTITNLYKEINYLFNVSGKSRSDIDHILKKFFNLEYKDFSNITSNLKKNDNLEDSKTKILYILFPNSEQEDSSKEQVLNEYKTLVLKKLKVLLKEKKTDKLLEQNKNLVDIIMYYCILHMQCECACSTSERCDFPYINYYKYLLKRNEIELLSEVNWHLPNARSKNKINRYKIEVQIYQPGAYSIINKMNLIFEWQLLPGV